MTDSEKQGRINSKRHNQEKYDYIDKYYQKVRIFLSSTFQDMKEERDLVVNLVNKTLHPWGEEYGLDIQIVDLRWGISVSESQNGRTVPLCLRAVTDCIPFVISFIGERKGWIPQKGDLTPGVIRLIDHPEILEKYNYSEGIKNGIDILRKGIGKESITEMEIDLALQATGSDETIFLIKHAENESELCRKAKQYNYVEYETNDTIHQKRLMSGTKVEDFLFDYITEKCMKLFPERVKTYTSSLEYQFHKDCFEYGKRLNQNCRQNNFLIFLEELFQSEFRLLQINGNAKTGKKQVLTILHRNLVKYFLVDVLFTYQTMSMEMLEYEMKFLGRNFQEIMQVDPEGVNRPIIILAPSMTEEVIKYIDDHDYVYGILCDKQVNSMKVTIPELNTAEIKYLIEKKLAEQCKRLTYLQVARLCKVKNFVNVGALSTFVDELNEVNDYEIIDQRIDSIINDTDKIIYNVYNMEIHEGELAHVIEKCEQGNDILTERLSNNDIDYAKCGENFEKVYKFLEGILCDRKIRIKNTPYYDRVRRDMAYVNCNRILCIRAMVVNEYDKWNKIDNKSDEQKAEQVRQLIEGCEKIVDCIQHFTYKDPDIAELVLHELYDYSDYSEPLVICDFGLLEDFLSRSWNERINMVKLKFVQAGDNFPLTYYLCYKYTYTADETTFPDGSVKYTNVKAHPLIIQRLEIPIEVVVHKAACLYNLVAGNKKVRMFMMKD